MSAIKIGLDFGTHQTKICIEKVGSDKKNPMYTFYKFKDIDGKFHYALPSVVQLNEDRTLSYGFTISNYKPTEPVYEKPEKPDYRTYKEFPEIKTPPQKLTWEEFYSSSIYSNKSKIDLKNPWKDYLAYVIQYEQCLSDYQNQCKQRNKEIEENKKNVDEYNAKLKTKYEKSLKQYQEYKNNIGISENIHQFRNFKQAVFSDSSIWEDNIDPMLISIWYLSYIFFDIEKEYGKDFAICMGTSSGWKNWEQNKQKAVQIMLTVYDIVENVCENDKDFFLALTIDELLELTQIKPYSGDEKIDNQIFVFPEAYANINPLAKQKKFGAGINLIVDIGGGTTDISLFSIYNNSEGVYIYDYSSVPYGINSIDKDGCHKYFNAVENVVDEYIQEFTSRAQELKISQNKIESATNNRPIVFAGGGSLRQALLNSYLGFSDIIRISKDMAANVIVYDFDEIPQEWFPILNTALGLAQCNLDDSKIPLETYETLFENVKMKYLDSNINTNTNTNNINNKSNNKKKKKKNNNHKRKKDPWEYYSNKYLYNYNPYNLSDEYIHGLTDL